MSSLDLYRVLRRWDAYRAEMLTFADPYDLILCPVFPSPARRTAACTCPARSSRRAITTPANLTGWPAATVRCGTSPEGLPIGVQLVARPWRDDVALAAALHLERELGGFRAPAAAARGHGHASGARTSGARSGRGPLNAGCPRRRSTGRRCACRTRASSSSSARPRRASRTGRPTGSTPTRSSRPTACAPSSAPASATCARAGTPSRSSTSSSPSGCARRLTTVIDSTGLERARRDAGGRWPSATASRCTPSSSTRPPKEVTARNRERATPVPAKVVAASCARPRPAPARARRRGLRRRPSRGAGRAVPPAFLTAPQAAVRQQEDPMPLALRAAGLALRLRRAPGDDRGRARRRRARRRGGGLRQPLAHGPRAPDPADRARVGGHARSHTTSATSPA